jgi:hypothetical protein
MPTYDRSTHEILNRNNNLSSVLLGLVNPRIDLVSHVSGSAGDSFYLVSDLTVKDGPEANRKFTVLFDLLVLTKLPLSLLGVAVYDEQLNKYRQFKEIDYGRTIDTSSLQNGNLNIKIVDSRDSEAYGTLSGTLEKELKVTGFLLSANGSENLEIALTMTAFGPMLNYLGEGAIPFAGGVDYEFALPFMQTTGKIKLGDRSMDVIGNSWLDRQWGYLGEAEWTWICVWFEGDVKGCIAVWDQTPLTGSSPTRNDGQSSSAQGGSAFATILDDSDNVIVAAASIFSGDERADATKLLTGEKDKLPYTWRIEISGYSDLTVTSTNSCQTLGPEGIDRREARGSATWRDRKGVAFIEVGKLDLQKLAKLLSPQSASVAPGSTQGQAASAMAPNVSARQ